MPLTFDDDYLFSPLPDGVGFTAYEEGIPIVCRITHKALVEIAGGHPYDDADFVAIFLKHRAAIEAAAAAWHQSNGEPVVLDIGSVGPMAIR